VQALPPSSQALAAGAGLQQAGEPRGAGFALFRGGEQCSIVAALLAASHQHQPACD